MMPNKKALCLYIIFLICLSGIAGCSKNPTSLTLEEMYDSYWGSEQTVVCEALKITETDYSVEELNNGLSKTYTSKNLNYVFHDNDAELFFGFYDNALSLIGCRIYFEEDNELYSFMKNQISEYDQDYELIDDGGSSTLRNSETFEDFQKITEYSLKADGIFTSGLDWNFNSDTQLKMTVVKSAQNEKSALTISLHNINLTQNILMN